MRRILATAFIAFSICTLSAQESIPVLRSSGMKVSADLPASVDNSLSVHFPPIIDQKGGSCAQASYIGYMFTYEINSLLDRDASDPANRFSYFYTWNLINGGKDEGSIGTDGLNIALGNGVITEKDFPEQYSGTQFLWASGYDKYFTGMHYRVRNFLKIPVKDMSGIDQVRQYLYNRGKEGEKGGIVTFSSRAGGWTFDNGYNGPSETGYHSLLTRLSPTGAHAMTIVGYDDLVEFKTPDGNISRGAFIVANTYGEWYHDRGRYYLPYWFFLQERDPNELSYEVIGVTVEYREPEIVFKVGLDYTSRDDISFRFGVSGSGASSYPEFNFDVPVMTNQGGDYPMQGKYGEPVIELGFDFSPFAGYTEKTGTPKYFLTVMKNDRGSISGEGKMVSFAVYDYRQDRENPAIYSSPEVAGKEILKGENIFGIATVEAPRCSYSPVRWLGESGQPVAAPLVFRTAEGKYAKVRFSDYDRESGTIKIKYVYAKNGGRNLK